MTSILELAKNRIVWLTVLIQNMDMWEKFADNMLKKTGASYIRS